MTPVRARMPHAPGGMGGPPGEGSALEGVRLALELEVPTDVRLIDRIVQLVSRQVRELEFPANVCSLNVPVALSEALSNAMLRGNEDDPAKLVRIRVLVDPTGLVLEISDEGGGFDLDECTQDPTTPANVTREDGRGLFLMRRLMDRVERYTESHGLGRNVVRLTIKRPPLAGSP
jgi:serine/threonine-protein kinase RsbW